MDEKLMESYLDNIAELVVEEDRIVTYKSLSKGFGIHVNTAKQLLSTYLSKEKSKNSFPISATYLLAGKLLDGSFHIRIVNESNLRSSYLEFSETPSQHVYSIQKDKSLREARVLCGIDKDSTINESPTVIVCSKSILKSGDQVKKKSNFCDESGKKLIQRAFTSGKEETNFDELNGTTENCRKKGTLTKSPKNKSPKELSQKIHAEVRKPGGSIADLFAKAGQKNVKKSVQDSDIAIKNSQKKSEPQNSPPSTTVNIREDLKIENSNLDKSNQSKKHNQKGKKGSKRKRIQMLSDSEDSESSAEEKSFEKEEPPLPLATLEEDKEEIIRDSLRKNKRKKRKVIDKTVMNEDGYLETKKEIVFETDSENEINEEKNHDSEQKKMKGVPRSEKEKTVPSTCAGKKQSSLLSFFKKS